MNNLNGARKVWTNITKQKFNRVPWPSPRGTDVLGANNKPNICLLTIEKTICTTKYYLNCKHKIKTRVIEM